jgi:HK97 family phage portal protein
LSFIRRALTSPQKRSTLYPEADPWTIPPPGSVGQLSPSGVLVNDENVMGLPVVWACTRILSGSVSTLDLKVFTLEDGVRREVLPQPSIIASPFLQATLLEGLDQIMISLIFRGNAYAVITARDAAMRPTQLFILHPDSVRVKRDSVGNIVYTVNRHDLDPADIVHIKNMVAPGSLQGLACLDHMRTAFGAGLAAEEYASRFYNQGALLSGFISVPDGMEEDDARRTNEMFKSRHTGLGNAHNPAILTGGATWETISVTPEQAQFLQTRQYSDSTIATMMGVPPHLLGMVDKTTSWGTGIEIQGRAFVDYTLRNYLTRIERALSELLPATTWVEFDTDSLTRADTATRYANYALGMMNGFLNADEVRAEEGKSPIPNGLGATFRVLSTLSPIAEVDTDTDDSQLPAVDPDSPGAGAAVPVSESPPHAA